MLGGVGDLPGLVSRGFNSLFIGIGSAMNLLHRSEDGHKTVSIPFSSG